MPQRELVSNRSHLYFYPFFAPHLRYPAVGALVGIPLAGPVVTGPPQNSHHTLFALHPPPPPCTPDTFYLIHVFLVPGKSYSPSHALGSGFGSPSIAHIPHTLNPLMSLRATEFLTPWVTRGARCIN